VRRQLKGTFFVSQAVRRVMIRQRSGRIVNLSSQAGFVALPGESVLHDEGGHRPPDQVSGCRVRQCGITVNAAAPTFIMTPGTAPALDNADFKADVIERIAALHRVGQPMDVAGAIVFWPHRRRRSLLHTIRSMAAGPRGEETRCQSRIDARGLIRESKCLQFWSNARSLASMRSKCQMPEPF
jgi:NAD(P)-dependent dehydrogenase (short-subunit alcohol dehydrogenase family)